MKTETPEVLKIDDTDVFLQEIGPGQGKITISNTWGYNFSFYWGSMGGTLKEFLLEINQSYFCSKLMGPKNDTTIDAKRTFTEVRKHIRQDILYWWEHMEFQKHLREELNSFQRETDENGSKYFVDYWSNFINRLDFSLIEDRYDAKRCEENFRNISEPWHFIVDKPAPEYIWLEKLFMKLQKEIKKQQKSLAPIPLSTKQYKYGSPVKSTNTPTVCNLCR